MRWSWNALIAALAVAALTCTVSGSNAVEVGDRAALRLAAGPGESTEPGGADAVPGEAGEDEGPAASPGTGTEDSKPGGPGEKAEGKTAPSDADEAGEADAKTTEAKPEKDATEAKETASEPDEDDKTKTAEKPEDDSDAKKPKKSDIPPPADPVALAAFRSLEKNCARCHQVGPLLKKSKPEKNFGHVMELDVLARDSQYVIPGVPTGSKLFKVILNNEMPYDCYQEFDCKDEPTETDIQAIFDWIESVGNPQCLDRKAVHDPAIVAAIAADLDQQPDERRAGMRYITLSHLYNMCSDKNELKLYRQAVVKLLNSLSHSPDVLRMRTIDPAETIIAFNLDDLNWTQADWNLLISAYPYAMRPDVTAYETVKTLTQTPLAWIRGDWLAFTASRPPLYYDLLKLPKTFAGLEKQVDVDVKSNIERFLVKRAGFQKSGVSKHNRLIERHRIPTGYFWTSYDFKGDGPEQSLFLHPLGPDGDNAFKHDGGESIFSLPNGFQAYYLNTAKGDRLVKGPTEIVLDPGQRDQAVTNGISCFGCHKQGINRNTDEIRGRVLDNRSFSNDTRKKVAALYPSVEDMNSFLDTDTKRYQTAMKQAGLSTTLDTDGAVESINALSQRYERDVLQYMAAAEFGLDLEQFKERLNDVGGKFVAVKQQLEQGQLPRGQLEPQFKELLTLVSDNLPVEVGGAVQVATVADTSDITLVADRSNYKVNDLPTFTVTPKKDCHLTVINVDSSKEGTVIFPNPFEQDNFVSAGKSVQIPPADGSWQFRLKDPGTETVIAICNAGGKQVDGIKHDFKKRGFTDLGNYRGFVTRQIVAEAKDKLAKGQKQKAKDGATAKSEIVVRTAIKLKVE